MGMFVKGSGNNKDLNFVKDCLDSAEGYLKSSKNNPPDVRSASSSYQAAATYLETMRVAQKDSAKYASLKTRAENVARSILSALPDSVSYSLASAERDIESGDSIRASQEVLRSTRETPGVDKYMQMFRDAHPELAREEQERKQREADIRKFLRSADSGYGDNSGYAAAHNAISQAEKDLDAVGQVVERAGIGDVGFGLEAARKTIKDVRSNLELRKAD